MTLHFVMARCHRNEVSVVKVVIVVSVDKVVSVEMLRFGWVWLSARPRGQ